MNRFSTVAMAAFLLFLLPAKDAHAYIDPGTGSLIVTAILGLIAAVGYHARRYYDAIKAIFVGGKAKDKEEREQQ